MSARVRGGRVPHEDVCGNRTPRNEREEMRVPGRAQIGGGILLTAVTHTRARTYSTPIYAQVTPVRTHACKHTRTDIDTRARTVVPQEVPRGYAKEKGRYGIVSVDVVCNGG